MSIRERLDISAYLVIGQENTTRPVEEVVAAAVSEGFTCIQIRSKVATAREMIDTLDKSAAAIRELGKSDSVALLVDDRLDVVLAARDAGIKVDGVHVGQSDIPVDVCRKYLGADSIVGLSARTEELIDYVKAADVSQIDYFGAGPLHATETKLDAGKTSDGRFITHGFKEIAELVKVSPRPIVVGGGVKLKDIPALAATNVAGFFVVSAVAGADNPRLAARELVEAWRQCH
ncbi:MAG: thiamine phosphate synthase [Selenomonadaceae bacterium]|nr:thiamine phosphate synthase [Selenomonadaceae bacterium]